jgi:hypothetical protein
MIFKSNNISVGIIKNISFSGTSKIKESLLEGGEIRNLDAVSNIEGIRKAAKILKLSPRETNTAINNLLMSMGVGQEYFGPLKNLDLSTAVTRAGEVSNFSPSEIQSNQKNYISIVNALANELVKNVRSNNSSLSIEADKFGRDFNQKLDNIDYD